MAETLLDCFIRRDGQEFIPHGDTYLKASDSNIIDV